MRSTQWNHSLQLASEERRTARRGRRGMPGWSRANCSAKKTSCRVTVWQSSTGRRTLPIMSLLVTVWGPTKVH